MLDLTFKFLTAQLNAYLGARYPSSEPQAVAWTLCNPDGSAPPAIENKVVFSLVNVEREDSAGSPRPTLLESGAAARLSPPLNLNLLILASASFADYDQGLKMLSAALGFFQGRPVFTSQSGGGFPRGLEKLTMEIVNLDMMGQNNLWGHLGGKYLPSVLYKARMFTLQEGWILDEEAVITTVEVKL